ncbi:MAG: hypothetical protein RLZZ337_418 [Bacteroidota bacterium]|jgi:uncharacterized protein YkwD
MKKVLKSILAVALVACASSAFAQFDKIEEAIADGNFKRAEKIAEGYLEDQSMKKYPETYYYYAQALYENSKDPFYWEKNPEAIKEAVKAIEKGLRKDEDRARIAMFDDVLEGVVKRNNELAMDQYNINKISKAGGMFDDSYALNGNRFAYFMSGKCAIEFEDTAKGEEHYEQLITWYNNDLANEVKDAEQVLDPHTYFINKYWSKLNYDSAKYFIKNARAIFGDDAKVNFYQTKVTLDQVKDMPPSLLLLDYVQEALLYAPLDDKLLHKENAVYIYIIKNKITNNQLNDADSLLNRFANEKVAKSALPKADKIKEVDIFVEAKAENVLWDLAEYFQTYGHLESAKFTLDKYINKTAKSNAEGDIASRWSIIADYAFKSKKLPFSAFVLQQAILKYPQDKVLAESRKNIIAAKENERLDVDEQGALYSLMKDEFAVSKTNENKERIIKINDRYLGLLVAANRFSSARDIMSEQMVLAPEVDHSYRLEFIAREDFYQNYYQTKTIGKDNDGNDVYLFQWDGSTSTCEPGVLDMDIQTKVANRINYFRRNAGVPEVLFDAATNEYCQKAALMMTANRNLEHNPPRTWRCYSDDGAYAAKHSLLIKDANTSLAVTYIMDDKNPSAGNRRWLLYPNGRVYGHGSTDDVAVIWTLDDSGSTDTAQYMDNPVCWPPKGDVPQIMLFQNWTFSIYRDLTDAKVEVKQDGKALDVKVEKFVRGYGAPTLVFTPNIEKQALPDKSKFDVTVTLSNGRKYLYTVRTFYYDPSKR